MKKKGFFDFSTEQFATAVLFEFALLSVARFVAVSCSVWWLWLVVFMAYFLHLFVHIAQWMAYRKYVPTAITTILTLPYCIFMIYFLTKKQIFSASEWVISTLAGLVLMICIVPLAHFLVEKSIHSRQAGVEAVQVARCVLLGDGGQAVQDVGER